MIRSLVIDREVPLGTFTVHAETITIEDDGFEFAWSVTPPPTHPEPVRDSESGRVRLEQMLTPLPIWWRIRDDRGIDYAEAGGVSYGDERRSKKRDRYEPAPSAGTAELVLTLHEIIPREDFVGREIEVLRVPLDA